jgi:DNA-binding MarR family transcriptional regulator
LPLAAGMKAIRRLNQSHYEMLAALRYGLLEFLQFSRAAAERAGLTPQQHQALLAIKGCPERDYLLIGELAERLHLKHHSVVELVDRLVERSLVKRAASAADRRRVEVRLSAKGEAIIRKLSAVHLAELREHGPELHRLLGSIIQA